MSIEDDLKARVREVGEIQKASGGGARGADAARLIGDYSALQAAYSPRPADPAKLAEMRGEQEKLLKRMVEFLNP